MTKHLLAAELALILPHAEYVEMPSIKTEPPARESVPFLLCNGMCESRYGDHGGQAVKHPL